jgi:hypothetical protein
MSNSFIPIIHDMSPPVLTNGQGECTKDGGPTVKLRGEISFDEITMDDRDDLQVPGNCISSIDM